MTECSPHTPTAPNQANNGYVGRFAPSPTGPLHYGSLFTAIASYLHARQHNGQWLIRIEDLDPPREQPGASEDIIRTLANWGMESDQTIWFQSERLSHYDQQIDALLAQGQAYRCYCSRKQIAAAGLSGPEGWRYNGHCRDLSGDPAQQHSIRFDCRGQDVEFKDELQGTIRENPADLYGDFPIKRADGYIAYQLAVVMDDAAQGVSHIVRGIDLLSSTSRQIRLQQALQLPQPQYCHLPVIVNAEGQKLSKQTFAKAVPPCYSPKLMSRLLSQLGLKVPTELAQASANALLQWATEHWQPSSLKQQQTLKNPG